MKRFFGPFPDSFHSDFDRSVSQVHFSLLDAHFDKMSLKINFEIFCKILIDNGWSRLYILPEF